MVLVKVSLFLFFHQASHNLHSVFRQQIATIPYNILPASSGYFVCLFWKLNVLQDDCGEFLEQPDEWL